MRRFLLWALALGAVFATGRTCAASFEITVEEEGGVARHAEGVTVSLPFADGALREPLVKIANAAGQPVDGQFEVLARWGDGSIRWLSARFFVDVPAGGRVLLIATPGESSAAQGSALAKADAKSVTVETGALRAVVGGDAGDSFLVTDTQGKPLLAQRPSLVVYTGDGQAHRCGPPETVEVEVNGPHYASLFVAGPITASTGEPVFRYETRLHFWRGKAEVLTEHTLVSVGGPPVTVVDGIVVHLAAERLDHAVLGGASRPHEIDLPDTGPVRLTQACAFWQECFPVRQSKYLVLERDFSYAIAAGDRRFGEGERAPGWLWAASQERSLGMAVRDFWEEGPKGLSVTPDGQIAVEIYQHWQPKPGEPRPKREPIPDFGKDPRLRDWFATEGEETVRRFLADTGWEGPVRRGPMRFGRTRAKTGEVRYLFGQPNRREAELDVLAAQRKPLVAVVDPDYLCGTRALQLVEVSARRSGLPVFENALVGAFRNFEQQSLVYGFLHFGDNQCNFGYNETVPSTADVMEYDTIRCLLAQFARTGIVDYFRRAQQAARHYADVDQDQVTGAVRFHGYRPRGEYHEEPLAYDMGGHIYIQGMVDHYALTGDRRSRRSFLRVGEAIKNYAPADCRELVLKQDERSLTRPAIALLAIYDFARDPKYLESPRRMVEGFNAAAGDVLTDLAGQAPFRTWWLYHGDFVNHVTELLARYHMATQDPATLRTLRKTLDLLLRDHWNPAGEAIQMSDNLPLGGPVSGRRPRAHEHSAEDSWTWRHGLAFAYAARATGEKRYLAPVLDHLEAFGQGWEDRYANRQFTLSQLWSVPTVSLLPPDWTQIQEEVVLQEVFRAALAQTNQLAAWTPDGLAQPRVHGEVLSTDSPWGRTLRTYGSNWVSYPAPRDLLLFPGTLSVWVNKEAATWGREPWPWYSERRGLVHIAGPQHHVNALDLMVSADKLWARLYDPRGWEIVALSTPTPWDDGQWHHLAVAWNRASLTLYVDGKEAARDEASHLPGGGQQTIHLGWRPGNWYGQAGFHNLRLFRTALTPERIQRLFESERPAERRTETTDPQTSR